jgi:hypothetical protein
MCTLTTVDFSAPASTTAIVFLHNLPIAVTTLPSAYRCGTSVDSIMSSRVSGPWVKPSRTSWLGRHFFQKQHLHSLYSISPSLTSRAGWSSFCKLGSPVLKFPDTRSLPFMNAFQRLDSPVFLPYNVRHLSTAIFHEHLDRTKHTTVCRGSHAGRCPPTTLCH